MKALVLEENGKLTYKDVADPIMQDDECLVAIKNAGVCGSDIHRAYQNWAYSYPLIMGHEFAGEVIEKGKLVTSYEPGDKVAVFPLLPCKKCEFCKTKHYAQCIAYNYYGSRRNGGFAQYIAVKEWNLFKIPNNLSFKRAAVIEPVAVAFHAIAQAEIHPHEKIAILGAGFIGLITAFILSQKINPKAIYLIDQDKNKLTFASQHGFQTIYTKEKTEWAQELIQNGGLDTVFEICGARQTFQQSLMIAKSHGKIIWVGNITGDLHLEKNLISTILRKELIIKGSWNSSFTHDDKDDWHKALNFVNQSKELEKMFTHTIALEDSVQFFESRKPQQLATIPKEQALYIKAIFEIK